MTRINVVDNAAFIVSTSHYRATKSSEEKHHPCRNVPPNKSESTQSTPLEKSKLTIVHHRKKTCISPLGLGFPPFLTPGCLWFAVGAVYAWWGAGRLGPPDAMEWLVVGAACCLARALLAAGAAAFAAPTSLRCLFGGSSDQSPHTCISPFRACVL